jgi:hypothetical protein
MPTHPPVKVRIRTSKKVEVDIKEVEVDIDEDVEISKQDILEAIQDDPSILEALGLAYLNKLKNSTLLDSIKLETIFEILQKCTLEDLEKFKQTL